MDLSEIDKLLKIEHIICPVCAKHVRTEASYSARPNIKGVTQIVRNEIPNISQITALRQFELCCRCYDPRGRLERVTVWERKSDKMRAVVHEAKEPIREGKPMPQSEPVDPALDAEPRTDYIAEAEDIMAGRFTGNREWRLYQIIKLMAAEDWRSQ